MHAARTRLGIVYPTDPLGSIAGGIESFIRGIIRHAPADIEISVIGATTDAEARPVGRWLQCALGPATYGHYATYAVGNPGQQARIPATLRFMAHLLPLLRELRGRFDVLEFHRIEPAALFVRDPTPKTAVLHQNMDVIRSSSSDIRWKYLPGAYFQMERWLLHRFASVYVVREDAVQSYRKRYADLADIFHFTPTWMDPDIYHPVSPELRASLREQLLRPHGLLVSELVLISVGRLDRQKDPVLLAEAFASLCRSRSDLRLIYVGDGVLRRETEAVLRAHGVADRVIFTGLLSPTAVAQYLNASDLFVLASAYEGMPMCLLEALGCGLPVCSTDVGEVGRAVRDGINGRIVGERTARQLAHAIGECLDHLDAFRGAPALDAASAFVPNKVLAPLYENYRRLARLGAS